VDVVEATSENEGCLAKINWTLQQFRLDELTDYYKNPRSLSEKEFKQLKTSLDKFGMIDKPIVNADSAHTIIGGHQRKHVLEATGVKEIECWIPDRELSDKEVEELNIRLNKNTGSWDFDVLANEFELDDLLDWGFDKGELDLDLWAEDAPEDVEPQIDKAEELRVKWGVETGQLWQLGEHRLVCGDSTNSDDVIRLLGEENGQAIITSPPYGVGMEYEGAPDETKTISLISAVFSEWCNHVNINGFAFVNFGERYIWSKPMVQVYHELFSQLSWRWYDQRFWKRSNVGMAIWNTTQPRAMSQVEYLFTFQNGKGSYPVHDLSISKEQIWDDAGSSAGLHHPAVMAEGIAEKAIAIYTDKDDIVLEPFSGSGTTLIACERLGRKCRAVEISPAYVAVAIQRWVDVTNGTPELVN